MAAIATCPSSFASRIEPSSPSSTNYKKKGGRAMCRGTTCKKCGKATWKGCGNHIEEALAGVPKNERCTCREDAASAPATSGFLARLRGN